MDGTSYFIEERTIAISAIIVTIVSIVSIISIVSIMSMVFHYTGHSIVPDNGAEFVLSWSLTVGGLSRLAQWPRLAQ